MWVNSQLNKLANNYLHRRYLREWRGGIPSLSPDRVRKSRAKRVLDLDLNGSGDLQNRGSWASARAAWQASGKTSRRAWCQKTHGRVCLVQPGGVRVAVTRSRIGQGRTKLAGSRQANQVESTATLDEEDEKGPLVHPRRSQTQNSLSDGIPGAFKFAMTFLCPGRWSRRNAKLGPSPI